MNFRMIKTIIYSFLLIQSILFAQTDSIQSLNQYSLADTVKANEYFNISKSYIQKTKYDSSNIYLKNALNIYENLLKENDLVGLRQKMIQIKNNIGYNFCYLSKYDSSKKYLEEAKQNCFEKLGSDNLMAANIFHNLGIYYDFIADFDSSLIMLNRGLSIRLLLLGEKSSDVADSYNSIGVVYSKRSLFEKAFEYFNKTLAIKIAIYGEEDSQTATAYHNIGIIFYDRGDYGKALEYYEKALKIRLKSLGELNQFTASTFNNIGNTYYSLGEYDNAIENHLKSLSIRKNLYGENHTLVATSYNNIGLQYWKKLEGDKALKYFNKSLTIRKYLYKENHPSISQSYMNIGLIYFLNEKYDSAIVFYKKSLDIWKVLGEQKISEVTRIYQNLSEAYQRKEDYDSAFVMIQKAIISCVVDFNDVSVDQNPKLENIITEKDLLHSLKIKAKIFLKIVLNNNLTDFDKIDNLIKSLIVSDISDKLIDRMMRGYKNIGSKYSLGESSNSIYEQGIKASLSLFNLTNDIIYKEKALYYIEKSKAAVLQEGIIESKAKKFAKIPDEILKKENELKNLLTHKEALVIKEKSKKIIDSLLLFKYESDFFNLKNEYEDFISDLEIKYPAYYQLKYQLKVKSLNEIQNAIDDSTIIVEYFIGDSAIYSASITNTELSITTISKPDSINELVEKFYTSIRKSEKHIFINEANKLTDLLINPVADKISRNKNLIVIPHDLLFKIPFEPLFFNIEKRANIEYSKLNYLILQNNISYEYSASLLVPNQQLNQHKETKGNFIGFAPIFPKDNSFGYTITNNNSANLLASNDEVLRSVSVDGKNYDELKYSEWEVNSIIDLFNKNNSSSINTAYFYSDAKEDSFKTNVKDYKIIHIASHSFMNADQPDLSGVIFAQPQDSIFNNDGVLYSGETYNLDLNADLVVLSSCESGLGKLFKGEGMIGLTRGFLYSGANNIMFSLWKISDKHTSELMIEFYRQMMNGKKYSEALRLAKLKLISSEITARPRSWAGFLLIGND
jgi:CHAT domain-containing protein